MRKLIKKSVLWALFLGFFIGYSQEKPKSERRAIQKQQKLQQIEALVAGKEFVYKADRAFPLGYHSIELITNPNFIKFTKDSVFCDMPYFGRVTGSLPYGSGGGLKFEGAAENYSQVKKKKEYVIKTNVKGLNDSYKIQLTVYVNGTANLVINSNNRNAISYTGSIFPIDTK